MGGFGTPCVCLAVDGHEGEGDEALVGELLPSRLNWIVLFIVWFLCRSSVQRGC